MSTLRGWPLASRPGLRQIVLANIGLLHSRLALIPCLSKAMASDDTENPASCLISAGRSMPSCCQINAELPPGQVVDAVEVQTTTQELLQKSDSTVGTAITNEQFEELPLNGGSNGRLSPVGNTSAGTTPAVGTSGGISIGGQQGAQVAFLLDGVDNNNQEILTSHTGQKEVINPSVAQNSTVSSISTIARTSATISNSGSAIRAAIGKEPRSWWIPPATMRRGD